MQIYEWRILKALTQTQAAELIGVSQATVSRWEMGAMPEARQIRLVTKATNGEVTANDFVEGAR